MPFENAPAMSALYDELIAAADQRDVDGMTKAISLRLDIISHIQLEKLSERLRDNKHALAVGTLAAAVQDLYDACEMPRLTIEEMHDWMEANIKGFRRIPANATATEVKMLMEDAAVEARRMNWDEVKA